MNTPKPILFNYNTCLVGDIPQNLRKVFPTPSSARDYLGIFDLKKNDEPIYLLEKKDCYKSFYKIRMMITAFSAKVKDLLEIGVRQVKFGEIIEFNAEIDFNDFSDNKKPWYFEPETEEEKERYKNTFDLDDEKLLEAFVPEQLKEVKERLIRFLTGEVPNPVFVDTSNAEKIEFLEFTKDSADSWAGPYSLNEKLGAYAYIREDKELKPYRVINPATDWCSYTIPYSHRKEFCEKHNLFNDNSLENQIYHWAKEQKAEAWEQFPIKVKQILYAELMRRESSPEYLGCNLPFRLHLSGNDDCSYTAYFATKEDANKELLFLRKMQPLCFSRDICNRNYVFTN